VNAVGSRGADRSAFRATARSDAITVLKGR
jgi:hypothetical protein